MLKSQFLSGATGAVLLLAGCGSSTPDTRPERVPVTGVVRYLQQPVEGAVVVFSPQGGTHAALGRTDRHGRFKLMTFLPDDGAVPGDYLVSISKVEVTAPPAGATDDVTVDDVTQERSLLPDKYADPKSSGFQQSIAAGTPQELTFDLLEGPMNQQKKSPAGRRPVAYGGAE